MNSRSAASRPAAFDIALTIVIGVASLLVSRYLRNHFAVPAVGGWLWVCSASALIVAGAWAAKRGLDPLRFIVPFSATYLAVQIIMQCLAAYGML